jgi:preprotein translocase subunit SecF
MKLNIIGNKKWYLGLSAVFVGLAIASIASFGFKMGIDFKSGSMWQIKVPNVGERIVREFVESGLGLESPIISYDEGVDSYSIIFKEISEEEHQLFKAALLSEFSDAVELDFGTTSPSISSELRNRALWVIILVLLVMALHVTFALRHVSWPVKAYKYGIVTLIALAHDVIIAAGFFALVGYLKGIVIDTYFIVALLTVAGFSVQDTIVVFDRIRENIVGNKGKMVIGDIINKSLNEVIVRSINTSFSTMLVLGAIAWLGPISVRYFALTMIVGILFGTYSSIFVASPLLVLWHKLDLPGNSSKSAEKR